MSAYADKKSRPRRWTTGFSPGGAISIAYLKSIGLKTPCHNDYTTTELKDKGVKF
jgi:hypothetical protein